jgi:hypothetical protein
MRAHLLAGTLAALALVLLADPALRAERIPSSRVQVEPQHGTRPDIRVPYLTNGNGNLGVPVGQPVAPRIYASPIVDDPKYPQVRPVYNLPFYGGVDAFGSGSNGPADRTNPYPLSLIR